jgi:hypothetical protein
MSGIGTLAAASSVSGSSWLSGDGGQIGAGAPSKPQMLASPGHSCIRPKQQLLLYSCRQYVCMWPQAML